MAERASDIAMRAEATIRDLLWALGAYLAACDPDDLDLTRRQMPEWAALLEVVAALHPAARDLLGIPPGTFPAAARPEPTETRLVISAKGRTLVTFRHDGSIEFGPSSTPDAAARAFWQSIGAANPLLPWLHELITREATDERA